MNIVTNTTGNSELTQVELVKWFVIFNRFGYREGNRITGKRITGDRIGDDGDVNWVSSFRIS